jgi:hypothetical protein
MDSNQLPCAYGRKQEMANNPSITKIIDFRDMIISNGGTAVGPILRWYGDGSAMDYDLVLINKKDESAIVQAVAPDPASIDRWTTYTVSLDDGTYDCYLAKQDAPDVPLSDYFRLTSYTRLELASNRSAEGKSIETETSNFTVEKIEANGVLVQRGAKATNGMLKISGTGVANGDFLAVKRGENTFLIPVSPTNGFTNTWVTRTLIPHIYNGRYEFFVVDRGEWFKHHRLAAVGTTYKITVDIPAPAVSEVSDAPVAEIIVIETADHQPIQNGGISDRSILIFKGITRGTTKLALWAALDGEQRQLLQPILEWDGSNWLTAKQMQNGTYHFTLAYLENDQPASEIYTVTVKASGKQ